MIVALTVVEERPMGASDKALGAFVCGCSEVETGEVKEEERGERG